MAQLTPVADRAMRSRNTLVHIRAVDDSQFSIACHFPDIMDAREPFLPHFGLPDKFYTDGDSAIVTSTMQWDNALTKEQRLLRERVKHHRKMFYAALRTARLTRAYEYKQFKERIRPTMWYYHAYGFHTKHEIVPVDVKVITKVHRKTVIVYRREWKLFVAKSKGFRPKRGPAAYWRPLDRIGRRWLHYTKVKKRVTKKWFDYRVERHFRASFNTFEVPITDDKGRTGIWRFNRPLYRAKCLIWKLLHPLSLYEAQIEEVAFYKNSYREALAAVLPIVYREAQMFKDTGVAVFSKGEVGRLQLFSRFSDWNFSTSAIRFYALSDSSGLARTLIFPPGSMVYFASKPSSVWKDHEEEDVLPPAPSVVSLTDLCRPSKAPRVVDVTEDISREIDSGFVRLDELDFRSDSEVDLNLTRALVELKDVPATFAIGRNCISSIRKLLKSPGRPLPAWAKALFPVTLHSDLSKMPPKTLSLWAKAWRDYPVLRQTRKGVLTLQMVAGLYLCYKWGVVPTLADIAYVTNSCKEVLFSVRSGLSRLGNLSAVKANTACSVIKRLQPHIRVGADSAGVMEHVDKSVLPLEPFEFTEVLFPEDDAYMATTLPTSSWISAYDTYASHDGYSLWTPVGPDYIDTGVLCPDPNFWMETNVSAGLSAAEKWLADKAQTLVDIPLLLKAHYHGSRLFMLSSAETLRNAMKVQRNIVDRLTAQMKAYEVAFEVTPFSWAIGWLFDVQQTVRDIQNHWHNAYASFQHLTPVWGSVRAEAGLGVPDMDVLLTTLVRRRGEEDRDVTFRHPFQVYRFGRWITTFAEGSARLPTYDLRVVCQPILNSDVYASHFSGAVAYRRSPVLYEFEDWKTRFQVRLNGDKILALSAALLGFVKL